VQSSGTSVLHIGCMGAWCPDTRDRKVDCKNVNYRP